MKFPSVSSKRCPNERPAPHMARPPRWTTGWPSDVNRTNRSASYPSSSHFRTYEETCTSTQAFLSSRATIRGRARWRTWSRERALKHSDAFELLVATILSAQCTDERVNLVTPALFARFPNAVAFAKADPVAAPSSATARCHLLEWRQHDARAEWRTVASATESPDMISSLSISWASQPLQPKPGAYVVMEGDQTRAQSETAGERQDGINGPLALGRDRLESRDAIDALRSQIGGQWLLHRLIVLVELDR